MQIAKNLYIGDDVQSLKWITWKLRKNRKVKDIYCICMPHNKKYFVEIIKGSKVTKGHNESIIIGIATTKESAIDLIVKMFEEIYIPNPNINKMREYFISNT